MPIAQAIERRPIRLLAVTHMYPSARRPAFLRSPGPSLRRWARCCTPARSDGRRAVEAISMDRVAKELVTIYRSVLRS